MTDLWGVEEKNPRWHLPPRARMADCPSHGLTKQPLQSRRNQTARISHSTPGDVSKSAPRPSSPATGLRWKLQGCVSAGYEQNLPREADGPAFCLAAAGTDVKK